MIYTHVLNKPGLSVHPVRKDEASPPTLIKKTEALYLSRSDINAGAFSRGKKPSGYLKGTKNKM
jgi:hypothetical protein